ncbi:hypothetical protein OUZ56_003146 [Daphnia magna]|uniref:Uncharacterized protein n=1 Tax=Daphnia magna TaxID=35525 RepID=A0ABR0A7V5_9CRUS|nr:hypothetical protein OUZ56_003146 [Daphnia magna]
MDLGSVIDLYDSLAEYLHTARSNSEKYEEESKMLTEIQTYAADEKKLKTFSFLTNLDKLTSDEITEAATALVKRYPKNVDYNLGTNQHHNGEDDR